MTMPSSRWYVAHTHAHCEARAAAHLARQGFATYWPRYRKQRRHARRIEIVAAPLFPRYLFVAIDLTSQRWRAIESTVGVSYLVRNGNEPAAIRDTVIAELRGREEHGYVQLPARPAFAPGQVVEVIDGAFAHCFGLCEGMKDRERIAILLELLGRKVRVVLELDSVVAA
jgi:transcriptional antiterminator RfaH